MIHVNNISQSEGVDRDEVYNYKEHCNALVVQYN